MMEYGWMWSFGGFGFVFMIFFWGLLIWLIIWAITQFNKPKQIIKKESAMDLLRERFAKGEITKKGI